MGKDMHVPAYYNGAAVEVKHTLSTSGSHSGFKKRVAVDVDKAVAYAHVFYKSSQIMLVYTTQFKAMRWEVSWYQRYDELMGSKNEDILQPVNCPSFLTLTLV